MDATSFQPQSNNGDHQSFGTSFPGTLNQEESSSSSSSKPLNVLVLFPDDMRHDSLSSAGTQLVQTPFLDHLGGNLGMRFTHNCVTTSICWVSRATLFSGQYVSRHHSDNLRQPKFCQEGQWNNSWPYLLQQAGYFTGHIGKWQFRNPGFVQKAFSWSRVFEGKHWHVIDNKTIHTTDYTENSTIEFLRERPKDKPFALTVAFYPPKGIGGTRFFNPKPESEHLYANVTIPEAFDLNASFARLPPSIFTEKNLGRETWHYSLRTAEMYQSNMKDMYRMITEVDQACKNILEELESQGILNETLVIFTADNGFLHGEHGLSGKWFPFEESIRVPLIVHDPRMPPSKRGSLDDSFTLNVDLGPTILTAAHVEVPSTMQGRDFSELYRNPNHAPWRKDFYYEHPTHQGEGRIPRSSAVVSKELKYMLFDNHHVESLFHLQTDPLEHNDVSENPVFEQRLNASRIRYKYLKEEVERGNKI